MIQCEVCGKEIIANCQGGVVIVPGEYGGEMCENLQELRRRRLIAERNDKVSGLWPVPERYACATMTVDGRMIALSPDLQKAYESAHRFIAHLASGKEPRGYNLLVFGSKGLGKTHLAAAIALEAGRHGLTSIYCEESKFLGRMKAYFQSDRLAELSEMEILESADECDLLILDDIGKARQTDWSREALWSVFNGRYNERRSSVITTNRTPAELSRNDQWTGIISRLQQEARTIELKGANLRT